MERKEIFSGKTVEDAIETGLKSLGVTREEVEIETVEEGKKKLFHSVPAQVVITVKDNRTDGERAVVFLKGLFDKLGYEVDPVLTSEEEKIEIELNTDSTRGLIGRRGEMIDSIQVLAGAVANIGRHDYKRVVVDCGGYRKEREEKLRHIAEKLADKAVRLGKKVRLEPMNPYDRRTVHAALVDNENVTTKSEGKEPMRFVVIIPKNLKFNDKRDRYEGGRGGRGKFDRDRKDRNGGKFSGNRERKPIPHRELPTEETPQTSGTSFKRDSSSGSGYQKGNFSRFIGTYLGNSRENEGSLTADENKDEE